MKNMKYIIFVVLAGFLNSESIASDSAKEISRILVGEWEWETNNNNCHSLHNMAFRSNGTLTSTSESCEMASDGFGLFTYGWYVANDYICFTNDERQYHNNKPRKAEDKKLFLAQVKEGYVEERCTWKVKSYSKKEIEIEVLKESFTMVRNRWL